MVGGPADASFAAHIKTSRRCLGSLILKNARSSLSTSRSEGPLNFPFSIGPRKAVAVSDSVSAGRERQCIQRKSARNVRILPEVVRE